MQLTARNLSELIHSLRTSKSGQGQRRAEARVGLRVKVELMLLDPGTGFGAGRVPAWVRDISAGGIGLTCNRGFKEGEPFDLIIQAQDGQGEQEERIPCFISYCRPVGTDLFRIGAKFQDFKPVEPDS